MIFVILRRRCKTWFNAINSNQELVILIQIFFAIVTLVATSACQKDAVSTYQVPKEAAPAPAMAPAMMSNSLPPNHPPIGGDMTPAENTAPVENTRREATWKVPSGWQEQTPTEMRLGSFLIKGDNGKQADMSVVPLSGDAGGDLANINRWRGQISLAPIEEQDLAKESKTISPADRRMLFVDFANQGKRLMAAIYHREGRTWFFKMTGDDVLVENSKPAFMQFLRNLTFHANKAE